MLTAGALRSDGVNFDFCIRNRNVGGNLQHGGNPYPSGIVSQAHDADKRTVLTMNSAVRAAEDWEGRDGGTDLTELRQTVDNAQPNFVTNLHLHHFGCETGAHTLGVF